MLIQTQPYSGKQKTTIMSLLNAEKFLAAYLEQYEVEQKLDNRFETEMPTWDRDDLMKEYKRLSKRMNVLMPKINEEQFNEVLADTLCASYEEYKDSEIDLVYNLEYN